MSVSGKRIVVAVGGGIAAFKAVELVRELIRREAEVRVAMTDAGARFVGPVTFSGLTGKPAVVDLWDPRVAGEVHVELAAWADAVVVVPATANLIVRAASGLADDVVLATLLCFRGPTLFAPAMHTQMWRHPATEDAVARLCVRGATMVGPVVGPLASGETGDGRMSEPTEIADAVANLFAAAQDLRERSVLVTAGPTLEDIDPVRFIGNRSTGKMGYAIAEEAHRRGAKVTLISGPVTLVPPRGVACIQARSALEMRDAVRAGAASVDAVIMAAAVADYRPTKRADQKLKKSGERESIELTRNPDILAELGAERSGARPLLVGFAVETESLAANARKKLAAKRCDLIVANTATNGFGGDSDEVIFVDKTGEHPLSPMPKATIARHLLSWIGDTLAVVTPGNQRRPRTDRENPTKA